MTDGLPHRWRVTVTSPSGASARFHAVTWRGANKAIALAAIACWDQHRELPYDVTVEDRGPVEQDEHGVAVVLPSDLVDRIEW